MSIKTKKAILYSAFFAMLAVACYVIFFTGHLISNKYYNIITIISFALACGIFLLIVINRKTSQKRNIKIAVYVCIGVVLFMALVLPATNIFSQSLPFWPPRGTVYQYTGNSNSISQNEVGLMMRYYLDGKTLYANEDYPLNSHNGYVFITEEYEFVEGEYPVLSIEDSEKFYESYSKQFRTIHVQENPKLKIAPFKICLSTGQSDKMIILTDEEGSWYVITKKLYEETFGE
jgi:hypothetical protein